MTLSKKHYLIIAIVSFLAVTLLFAGCSKPISGKAESKSESTSLEVSDDGSKSSKDSDDSEGSVADKNIVMTIKGDNDTYVLQGEEYVEAGCQAVSKKSGVIDGDISIDGSVDTSTPGDYEINYTVATKDGKMATATRNVHVVKSFDGEAKSVPVLMYHYVYSNDDKPSSLNGNYLLDTKLADQCKYLKDNDYYFPSFEELYSWVNGNHTLPAKSVILTFDDGQAGFFKHGVPVLEEYEVPATSFVIGTKIGNKIKSYASPYVQYQSHSYNMHRPGGGNIGRGGVIYAYSKGDVADDIEKSNEITGKAVAFAYPFGDNDDKAREGLKDAGILCAFTIVNDKIHKGDNPLALNRVRISGEYSLDSYKALVSP